MTNKSSSLGRWIAFTVTMLVLAGTFLMAVREMLPKRSYLPHPSYQSWTDEVIVTAKGIPVQDGGRIKPFESYAGYLMLAMRGDRMIKVIGPDSKRIKVTPSEWLMDALFRPEMAVMHPSFRIDNSEVIELIGLEGRAKRDRYSYEELLPAIDSLFKYGEEYEQLARQGEPLDTVQKQTLTLARNVRKFASLLDYFSFARQGIHLQTDASDHAASTGPVSSQMANADDIRKSLKQARAEGGETPQNIEHLLAQLSEVSIAAKYGFAVLPPADSEKEWMNAGDQIWKVITNSSADPALATADIVMLEQVVSLQIQGDPRFSEQLMAWRTAMIDRAKKRGEYASVPLELSYNRGQWFFRALFFCFLPGAVFVALGWMAPHGRWGRLMSAAVWVTSVIGLVLLTIGITQRSLIMQRPPVGNLYDTMPFIAAGIILLALIAEALTRKRLALALAPLLGFFCLVMARRYEFEDASDPMNPLDAVLRSNYWLTIHVLTITFGYAAGLVTAAMGHIYVFLRIFKLDGDNRSLRRSITRMTYGCLCFTLLLSLTGTVLGGIWANDSWGRFWGWDPKENGALMIVLWSLFVLHARRGGIISEWGTNLWAVFGAVVITFSWWHVNLLGVGLHSYGFSESKKNAVFSFYAIEAVVLVLGIAFMIAGRRRKAARH